MLGNIADKCNPHVHVVGGGNRKSAGLQGRTKYGGKLYSPGPYDSHKALSGSTQKRAGKRYWTMVKLLG